MAVLVLSCVMRCITAWPARSRPVGASERDAQELEDAVFRQAYIPKRLDEVMHYERDHDRMQAAGGAKVEGIYYGTVTGLQSAIDPAQAHAGPSIAAHSEPASAAVKAASSSATEAASQGDLMVGPSTAASTSAAACSTAGAETQDKAGDSKGSDDSSESDDGSNSEDESGSESGSEGDGGPKDKDAVRAERKVRHGSIPTCTCLLAVATP